MRHPRTKFEKSIISLLALSLCIASAQASTLQSTGKARNSKSSAQTNGDCKPGKIAASFYIDETYAKRIVEKTDTAVSGNLFNKKLAETVWKDAIKKYRPEILKSTNLKELSESMGLAFAELKSSHCNFVTVNDEMYHFLHALFGDFNKKVYNGKTDYVGLHIGGKPFEPNQVRYVLDGGPAAKSGIKIGDRIIKVNGANYVGYCNFLNTAGSTISIDLERNGETKTVSIKPEKADLYEAYVDATHKSVNISDEGNKKIGYVHVWCGGRKSHDALEEILEEKLDKTDGIIYDLRDGYGGNDLSDLDQFYRTEKAYPTFVTVDRNGKKSVSKRFYDKPMVAIINGGSRSGKELVAFSLKRTGRAVLVGTRTAGAVLAGSITPIDGRVTAYIAKLDGTIDGVRLEGNGVPPDVEIDNAQLDQAGYDKQLATARAELVKLLSNPTPVK